MKVNQREISPRTATKLLAANSENNRHLRDAHVAVLARDMKNGNWVENGETIIISNTGRLLDGQHRLSAIVKSGVGQKMVVVSDVPDSYITTIDQGASRGLHDALMVSGFKNVTALASTYRLVSGYIKRGYASASNYSKRRTSTEAIEFCKKNPLLLDAVSYFRHKRNVDADKRASVVSDTVWATMRFLLEEQHFETLDTFYERVELGLEIKRGCPSSFLRNLCIDTAAAGPRPSSNVLLHRTATYWNEYVKDHRLRKQIDLSSAPKAVIFGARY